MSSNAAITLLSQMLVGITSTRIVDPSAEVPDFSLDDIRASGEHGVETTVQLATGDRYRVSVEWLREESP